MNRTRICLVAVVVLTACCGNPGDGRESPGDKREWSILQGLELESREIRTTAIEFRTVDEYDVMAVPRESDARVVWVLLNPAHPPLHEQMPEGNCRLEPAQLRSIVADHRVTTTVEEALRGHLHALQ